MTTTRQTELANRRVERQVARNDYAEGYGDGYEGRPLRTNSSPAYRVGHRDGVKDKGEGA